MDDGPWTGLGTFGWFLGVWVVMMAAMMLPSVAPTVALYSRMTKQRSPLSPLLFAAGYLLTWAAAGVLAFAIGAAAQLDARAACSRGIGPGGGSPAATLVVAAVYELTPLKDVCLGKCRSPLGFLLGSWRDGWSGALRMGAKNGAWCVGCCWALMAVAVRVGDHEHRVDGRGRRAHRIREDRPVAPRRVLRHCSRAPRRSVCSCWLRRTRSPASRRRPAPRWSR